MYPPNITLIVAVAVHRTCICAKLTVVPTLVSATTFLGHYCAMSDTHLTWLTVGVDLIQYLKMQLNSMMCTHKARCMACDITNFYLNTEVAMKFIKYLQ